MKIDSLFIHLKISRSLLEPNMNLSIHLALTLNYLWEIYQKDIIKDQVFGITLTHIYNTV